MREIESSGSRSRRRLESSLLLHLVILHPIELTLDELVEELSVDGAGGSHREAIVRATESLAMVGLVRRQGPLVRPTPAAIRFYELWER